MDNPYRAVQGTLPRKREVQEWSHDRFTDFLAFVTFFVDKDIIKVTKVKRQAVEEYLNIDYHPWQEFLYRINCPLDNPEATDRKFYYRLASMIRLVGGYLKQNPALVTEEMKEGIKDNPRLNWIIPHYKVVDTAIGAEVVVPATLDTTTFVKRTTSPLNAEVTFMETMLKTANLFDMIVSSIKPSEIRSMDIKEKIAALSKLSFIGTNLRQMKPTTQVFKQINIHKANKEDVEKAILDFAQEGNDDGK